MGAGDEEVVQGSLVTGASAGGLGGDVQSGLSSGEDGPPGAEDDLALPEEFGLGGVVEVVVSPTLGGGGEG